LIAIYPLPYSLSKIVCSPPTRYKANSCEKGEPVSCFNLRAVDFALMGQLGMERDKSSDEVRLSFLMNSLGLRPARLYGMRIFKNHFLRKKQTQRQ